MPRPEILQYEPIRPYARASRVADLLFLAGEAGYEQHTGDVVGGGITEQSNQAFVNIKATLDHYGLGWDSLVRMDVYLAQADDKEPFMNVLRRHLPGGSPPGALVCVSEFAHPGVLVEIECIAAFG